MSEKDIKEAVTPCHTLPKVTSGMGMINGFPSGQRTTTAVCNPNSLKEAVKEFQEQCQSIMEGPLKPASMYPAGSEEHSLAQGFGALGKPASAASKPPMGLLPNTQNKFAVSSAPTVTKSAPNVGMTAPTPAPNVANQASNASNTMGKLNFGHAAGAAGLGGLGGAALGGVVGGKRGAVGGGIGGALGAGAGHLIGQATGIGGTTGGLIGGIGGSLLGTGIAKHYEESVDPSLEEAVKDFQKQCQEADFYVPPKTHEWYRNNRGFDRLHNRFYMDVHNVSNPFPTSYFTLSVLPKHNQTPTEDFGNKFDVTDQQTMRVAHDYYTERGEKRNADWARMRSNALKGNPFHPNFVGESVNESSEEHMKKIESQFPRLHHWLTTGKHLSADDAAKQKIINMFKTNGDNTTTNKGKKPVQEMTGDEALEKGHRTPVENSKNIRTMARDADKATLAAFDFKTGPRRQSSDQTAILPRHELHSTSSQPYEEHPNQIKHAKESLEEAVKDFQKQCQESLPRHGLARVVSQLRQPEKAVRYEILRRARQGARAAATKSDIPGATVNKAAGMAGDAIKAFGSAYDYNSHVKPIGNKYASESVNESLEEAVKSFQAQCRESEPTHITDPSRYAEVAKFKDQNYGSKTLSQKIAERMAMAKNMKTKNVLSSMEEATKAFQVQCQESPLFGMAGDGIMAADKKIHHAVAIPAGAIAGGGAGALGGAFLGQATGLGAGTGALIGGGLGALGGGYLAHKVTESVKGPANLYMQEETNITAKPGNKSGMKLKMPKGKLPSGNYTLKMDAEKGKARISKAPSTMSKVATGTALAAGGYLAGKHMNSKDDEAKESLEEAVKVFQTQCQEGLFKSLGGLQGGIGGTLGGATAGGVIGGGLGAAGGGVGGAMLGHKIGSHFGPVGGLIGAGLGALGGTIGGGAAGSAVGTGVGGLAGGWAGNKTGKMVGSNFESREPDLEESIRYTIESFQAQCQEDDLLDKYEKATNTVPGTAAELAAGFVPGVGTALEVPHIAQGLRKGNYISAAGHTLGAGIGLLPGGGAAVKTAKMFGQVAAPALADKMQADRGFKEAVNETQEADPKSSMSGSTKAVKSKAEPKKVEPTIVKGSASKSVQKVPVKKSFQPSEMTPKEFKEHPGGKIGNAIFGGVEKAGVAIHDVGSRIKKQVAPKVKEWTGSTAGKATELVGKGVEKTGQEIYNHPKVTVGAAALGAAAVYHAKKGKKQEEEQEAVGNVEENKFTGFAKLGNGLINKAGELVQKQGSRVRQIGQKFDASVANAPGLRNKFARGVTKAGQYIQQNPGKAAAATALSAVPIGATVGAGVGTAYDKLAGNSPDDYVQESKKLVESFRLQGHTMESAEQHALRVASEALTEKMHKGTSLREDWRGELAGGSLGALAGAGIGHLLHPGVGEYIGAGLGGGGGAALGSYISDERKAEQKPKRSAPQQIRRHEFIPYPLEQHGQESIDPKMQEYITHSGDEYEVHSESGRNMGKFHSKAAAHKRLGQIEYFKHHPESVQEAIESFQEQCANTMEYTYGDYGQNEDVTDRALRSAFRAGATGAGAVIPGVFGAGTGAAIGGTLGHVTGLGAGTGAGIGAVTGGLAGAGLGGGAAYYGARKLSDEGRNLEYNQLTRPTPGDVAATRFMQGMAARPVVLPGMLAGAGIGALGGAAVGHLTGLGAGAGAGFGAGLGGAVGGFGTSYLAKRAADAAIKAEQEPVPTYASLKTQESIQNTMEGPLLGLAGGVAAYHAARKLGAGRMMAIPVAAAGYHLASRYGNSQRYDDAVDRAQQLRKIRDAESDLKGQSKKPQHKEETKEVLTGARTASIGKSVKQPIGAASAPLVRHSEPFNAGNTADRRIGPNGVATYGAPELATAKYMSHQEALGEAIKAFQEACRNTMERDIYRHDAQPDMDNAGYKKEFSSAANVAQNHPEYVRGPASKSKNYANATTLHQTGHPRVARQVMRDTFKDREKYMESVQEARALYEVGPEGYADRGATGLEPANIDSEVSPSQQLHIDPREDPEYEGEEGQYGMHPSQQIDYDAEGPITDIDTAGGRYEPAYGPRSMDGHLINQLSSLKNEMARPSVHAMDESKKEKKMKKKMKEEEISPDSSGYSKRKEKEFGKVDKYEKLNKFTSSEASGYEDELKNQKKKDLLEPMKEAVQLFQEQCRSYLYENEEFLANPQIFPEPDSFEDDAEIFGDPYQAANDFGPDGPMEDELANPEVFPGEFCGPFSHEGYMESVQEALRSVKEQMQTPSRRL